MVSKRKWKNEVRIKLGIGKHGTEIRQRKGKKEREALQLDGWMGKLMV